MRLFIHSRLLWAFVSAMMLFYGMAAQENPSPIPAADRTEVYIPMLKGKKIALVVNQTSIVGQRHLVDVLLDKGIDVSVVFAPEHGFRGKADAGEHIHDDTDPSSGLPILSLYGKKKKPALEDLHGAEMIVFDIQDVGVRFYTYLSTLHYIMEAGAELNVPVMVLDRPNPNGHYIDGPVLAEAYRSFVGLHPVPVVYGMTIGEYAQMINGEGWLSGGKTCPLTVVTCDHYTHDTYYSPPVKPSPNLPDIRAMLLYPSTCFFEGTTVSLGRGTEKQFQLIGHPALASSFSFTPQPNEGSKEPPQNGKVCYGQDLSALDISEIRSWKKINLAYLLDFYRQMKEANAPFFLETNFIDKLAGTDQLRAQLLAGSAEDAIRDSWKSGLEAFSEVRKRYLLYP
jgi:uncharacterized protein YbbC (DUF1343 family)